MPRDRTSRAIVQPRHLALFLHPDIPTCCTAGDGAEEYIDLCYLNVRKSSDVPRCGLESLQTRGDVGCRTTSFTSHASSSLSISRSERLGQSEGQSALDPNVRKVDLSPKREKQKDRGPTAWKIRSGTL
jgi:hypothetical protein